MNVRKILCILVWLYFHTGLFLPLSVFMEVFCIDRLVRREIVKLGWLGMIRMIVVESFHEFYFAHWFRPLGEFQVLTRCTLYASPLSWEYWTRWSNVNSRWGSISRKRAKIVQAVGDNTSTRIVIFFNSSWKLPQRHDALFNADSKSCSD